jgi:uncharacterized repeat protein (TIGR03803 family)
MIRVLPLLALAIGLVTITSPAQAHLRTLYSFCAQTNCTDGREPSDGLAIDSHGNLFGTTEFGGDANHGTVFELMKGRHGAYTYSRIYSFCVAENCTDGALPLSGVIIDNKGRLYGTTRVGGDANVGSVFSLVRQHGVWTETVLHSFCANCTDGAGPNALTFAGAAAGRVYDSIAPLYGTTFHGGDPDGGTGSGTVFQLVRADKLWTESVIFTFCQAGCASGANPEGKLTVDSSGTIYGTTVDGGAASDAGVVFSLAFDGTLWNETVLYSFCATGNCPDGSTPFAGVVRDSAGTLYGTTGAGGAQNAGTLYQLAFDGTVWNETVLYSFCARKNCADGKQPQSQLTLDGAGALFGTTFEGGAANGGVVFKWANGAYARPHSFCSLAACADGKLATGTLAVDRKGNLYGATYSGGAFGDGTVFDLTR